MSKKDKQKDNSIKVERPTIACLIPCYKQPHPKMQHAFAQVAYTAQKAGIDLYSQPIMQTSVVHWTRNGLISELIKSKKPFTHVLFIDDDIVPAPDSLVRLLQHNVDIIAALCTKRQDPPIPNARLMDPESGMFQELWEFPDGLVEVDAVGTGMMLISRNALQQVAEIYFQCLHEKAVYGLTDEQAAEMTKLRTAGFDADANGWWFRFLSPANGVGEMGEDISFCWAAKKYAGLKIHVDTTVQPGHMGDYDYGIKDFIEHRDPLIENAKATGKYMAPPSLLSAPKSKIVVVE